MNRGVTGAWLALCLCAAVATARAAVTAALSDTRIASGTTVELTLTYHGLTMSEPDLAPLRKDFDILGTSSSTSVQIGTGGSSESTQEVLTLAPKRTGRVTIPPISWDGEHSAPLTLTVSGAGSSANAAPGTATARPAAVFIVSRITPARPYVQAQVRLTVQIYTAERLYHGSLDFSGNGAVLVKHVGTDQSSNTVRNGQTYQVITRRFVLFPLHSGRIKLPGPVLDADTAVRQRTSPWGGNPFSGFFGGLLQTLRPIEVHGDPIILSVRRRPAGAAGRYWLPASHLKLTARWHPGTLRAQAGDPLTVTLDLQATGLTAAQLPDLASRLGAPAGLSAYPDQAKLHNVTQGSGLVGSREQTIALIANRPGHYVLPAIRIRWWDTRTDQPRLATLPARTLSIIPGATTTSASTPSIHRAPVPAAPTRPAPPGTRPPASHPPSVRAPHPAPASRFTLWQWMTMALGALWIATAGVGLWSRRRRHRPRPNTVPTRERPARPDATRERTAFRAACVRNDAPAARRHLLGWMAAVWGVPATSLNPLAAANRDPRLDAQLRELERACYGGGSWQGELLAQMLRNLPARTGSTGSQDDTLPPLYP